MKQRYHIGLALLFFILANAKVFAQQRRITGSVIDFIGNAMPGVNVIVIARNKSSKGVQEISKLWIS